MKKAIFLLAILLITAFSLKSQSPEPPDTVKVIANPEKVTISRSGDTTLVEVVSSSDGYINYSFSYEVKVEEPDESEPSLDFEIPLGIGKKKVIGKNHKKLRTSMFLMGNVYVGQRFNYYDKGNVKNSYEMGVRNLVGIRWSHGAYTPSFSIGIGCGTQRYEAGRGFMYSKEGSGLILLPVQDGNRIKSTELQVWNFQIPLLFTLPIGRDVEFVAGGVCCLNTYARARTEVEIDKFKYKTTYKSLQQRLFTAELTASLGVCDIIGVYASWSPMTLFQAPYGPQLKSWSIGATINF